MPIDKTIQITERRHAIWCHAFQNQNTQWISDQRIFLGNFFFGLQAQGIQAFDAQIPAGSQIHSAIMRVTANANSAIGTVTSDITTPDRQLPNTWLQPLQRPFESYIGWRPFFWADNDLDIRDTGSVLIDQTSGGTGGQIQNIRLLDGVSVPGVDMVERVAQRYVPSTSFTIGSITMRLRRFGTPAGSCRFKIMGIVTPEGGTVTEPDEVVLATSDDVVCTSIPTGAYNDITFTFSGANQILLGSAFTYFLVFEVDYTADLVNRLAFQFRSAFFNDGDLFYYGEGLGFDYQNYPGSADARLGTAIAPDLTTPVVWTMPTWFNGIDYDTPDISALLQAQVDAPWYTKDSGILIVVQNISNTNVSRVWRSPNYVPAPAGPQLIVSYTPPGGGVGYSGHGAVIQEPVAPKTVDKRRLARLALLATTVIDSGD